MKNAFLFAACLFGGGALLAFTLGGAALLFAPNDFSMVGQAAILGQIIGVALGAAVFVLGKRRGVFKS
jgi:hypothetical protein